MLSCASRALASTRRLTHSWSHGNNESVGPFGIGSTLTPFSPSLRMVRLGLAVRSLRLGQVLDATLQRAVIALAKT